MMKTFRLIMPKQLLTWLQCFVKVAFVLLLAVSLATGQAAEAPPGSALCGQVAAPALRLFLKVLFLDRACSGLDIKSHAVRQSVPMSPSDQMESLADVLFGESLTVWLRIVTTHNQEK